MFTIAQKVADETEYGERPTMDQIEDAKGVESYDDRGRWIAMFEDGSALMEDPVFGCVVKR
jgi:hypothetical protein